MPLQNLIDLLTPICSTVIEQGSMGANEAYPARFFTFWNRSTDANKFYNNAAMGYAWVVDVNFYSKDRADVFSTLEAARKALLQAGWKVSGKGYAVASDEASHTGRGFVATFLET